MAVNQKLTYQDLGREIAEMVDPNVAFQTQLVSPFLMTVLGFPGRLGQTFSTLHEWLEERLNANSTLVNSRSPKRPKRRSSNTAMFRSLSGTNARRPNRR